MLNTVRFCCTALVGTNKAGLLKKDDNGYYTLVLGALNVLNSAGAYYPYDDAKHLFTESSQLMRRIKKGALKGEYGHPKRAPGQSIDDFSNRVMQISEDQICCHIKEVWIDFDSIKDDQGRSVIAVIGKVIPSGPLGPVLEKSLQNPDENVCFSVRSFTADSVVMGRTQKVLKTIITWDYVNEPGIAVANKYAAPGLESFDETVFTRNQLERGLSQATGNVSMESVVVTAHELFSSMNWSFSAGKSPKYLDW